MVHHTPYTSQTSNSGYHYQSIILHNSELNGFVILVKSDDQNKQVKSVKILKYQKIFWKISFSNLNKIQAPTYLVIVQGKYKENKGTNHDHPSDFAHKTCQFVA